MPDGGRAQKAEGRVKKAAGELTDNESLKNEGRVDKASGGAKDKIGKAADKARDAIRRTS